EDDVPILAPTKRIYTRDQLLVSGYLEGEEIHLLVNHWPSRSGGEQKTSAYREAAGKLNKKIIDSLQQLNVNAKIITMGDLNDGPHNKSIKVALGAKGKKTTVAPHEIFNPFEALLSKGLGTIAHQDAWDVFDQIMLTGTWLSSDYSTWQYWKAGIFQRNYLIQTQGKFKGYPLRHSLTEVGYSDHFPVYVYLIREGK
ncbi:MAG: endonuclease/exonuclease/phosphatase family protein, partial [Flavobacterium sp.]